MKFFRIPEEVLRNGFDVHVPDYELDYHYTFDSKCAGIQIHNNDLILNPFSKEPKINFHFVDGPFVEIKDSSSFFFSVEIVFNLLLIIVVALFN